MDAARKFIKFLDNLTDKALLIIFLFIFSIGMYGLYDSYMVYVETTDSSILKYKPGNDPDEVYDKKIEGNMVAWLTIDDTKIDYPVMQGKENTEYLNKDPFGDYSLAGSIFLDSRNDPEFHDFYSLVYGHHMEKGMMFGALDDFLDEDFFHSHQTGTLIVGKTTYDIRIFAVLECDATQEAVFAPTETDNTMSYLKQYALYYNADAEPKGDQKLLGMSTCKYPDTADRTIIFGRLEEKK